MQDVHFIEHSKEAVELLKPIRINILKNLSKPSTCPDIAKKLGGTTQKVNYHMNLLKDAGLVKLIEERRNRGTLEGYYQAVAKSYWFSPRMVSMIGGEKQTKEQASLLYLLQIAEELQIDIGRLASKKKSEPIPSVALDGFIELKDQDARSSFFSEIQDSFKKIARKYASKSNQKTSNKKSSYRFISACYPQEY